MYEGRSPWKKDSCWVHSYKSGELGNYVKTKSRMVTKGLTQTPNTRQRYPRAFSFRNLVSGYGCGRVFPASVRPGSPSRDAANWLPSRFGPSVEMRRRYGWLRMVFLGVHLFRAPMWCLSGGWRYARSREHCREEPGSALSGGYAPD